MFDTITEKLQAAFRKLAGRGKLTESNIQDGLREVRVALLEADVNYKVVKDFIDRVTQKSIGQEVIQSISPAQQIIKIVHDELVGLMGGTAEPDKAGGVPTNVGMGFIQFASAPPTIIMMVGLQGCGKTTTCAKMAKYITKKGKRPLLVAADIQRPAAVDQLKALGKQLNFPVYSETLGPHPTGVVSSHNESTPRLPAIAPKGATVGICVQSVKYAAENNFDVVILDTAGRLHIDEELMAELQDINRRVKPQHIFLVADAMTGQDAVNSAKAFNEQLPLSGVILTKLDGDARGGAALSIKAVTGKPIKFVGIGEKMDNFEEFHPDRMASRILGMGDVVSLVEKAQSVMDEEKAKKLQDKMLKNKLDLQDFLDQLQQIKKMGSLKDLLGMIPGIGSAIKNIDMDDKQFKRIEAIIQSMTPKERIDPDILDGRRKLRISRGSGTTVAEINSLLKQFSEMQKMMKNMGKMPKSMLGKFMR